MANKPILTQPNPNEDKKPREQWQKQLRTYISLGGIFSVGKSKATEVKSEAIAVTYKDVSGADEAIVELQEIIQFLKTPEQFTASARPACAISLSKRTQWPLPSSSSTKLTPLGAVAAV